MDFIATVIFVVIPLVSVLLIWVKQRLSYWKRRGLPHDKPNFPVGSMKGFMRSHQLRDIIKEYYTKFKHTGPFAGFFFFLTPSVIVFDCDLIKDILIKDFNNFSDRGLFHNEKDDPLTGNIFVLDGPKWRILRNKLSPTFSSGKMKFMFPTVVSVGEELIVAVNKLLEEDSIIEVKDISARFTVDVIGTCAFGIDCNSLMDPNAEFRAMGAKAFTLTRHTRLIQGFMFSFPDLARKLHMRHIHEEVHQFFMRVVRETVEYREKNSIKRNDFMNLLIEIKNSGDGMTVEEIAAQVFLFFLAGFETSSTAIGFALYELSLNQDIQDKLRAEINGQMEKHDGKLTYECIHEMHYMEKVIKETLRKYFIVINIMRKSKDNYTVANTHHIIPKGTMVIIPADAIHRDPEIYPDPEKFDPERFSVEEMQKRHPMTWLPFGDGPRNCIGSRFGKMQTYIGLAMLLKNYKFHYSDKTPNPLEMDVTNPSLSVKGGIFLRVEKI